MPTNFSNELANFQPPNLLLAGLPDPSPRTVGRLRTVTNVTPPALYMDYGTYWAAIAGGGVTDGVFNVKQFGAAGNGTADDTAEINAAIAAANAATYGGGTVTRGAIVYFPPGKYLVSATLTAPTRGVRLLGANWSWGSSYWSASTINGTMTTTPLFDLGSTLNDNITIEKLTLAGTTSAAVTNTSNHAIYAADISLLHLLDLNIHGWGGSAVRLDSGQDNYIANVQATGCMFSVGSVLANTGVVHLGGGESVMMYCNINGPFGNGVAGQYLSGFVASVYVNTAPFTAYFVNGAFSEVGWHFSTNVGTGISSLFTCRADFNQGHGFWNEGADVGMSRCVAYGNGLDADATYSGFYTVQGGAGFVIRNSYSMCVVDAASAGYAGNTNRVLYAFTDANSGAGNTTILHNRYDALCRMGSNMATGARKFNITGTIKPSVDPLSFIQLLTGTGTQTFDGEQGNHWKLVVNANTATEITATNLVIGNTYELEVLNSSGAAPAITLNATLFKATTLTLSPADTKRKVCQFTYDGTNLILSGGGVSSDF